MMSKLIFRRGIPILFFFVLSACMGGEKNSESTSAQIEPDDSGLQQCPDTRPEICTMDYRPVCAVLGDGSRKTYSNGCGACADASVDVFRVGACDDE